MAQPSATSDLLRCPRNLKECIDWVICIETQKTDELAKALKSLVGTVELKTQLDPLASGLKKFLDEIKNKGSQYDSSYDHSKVKWPVCGSSSQCSGCQNSSPSCPCKSSGPCPAGECCENCDVKKAANIFLGFLPCLYYALEYLNEKCKGDWENFEISDNSLHRFLRGMGYAETDLNPSAGASKISSSLSSLINGSKGILDKIYNVVKEKYFTSFSSRSLSSGSLSPSTVRDMLLWLYGLRFQKSFPSLVSRCKDLCSPFGNSFHPDAFCYYIHTCCFLLPISVISAIQRPEGSKSFLPSHSDWKDFCYPSDTLELFETFCEYARKVYIALTFLTTQCKRVPAEGGWQECFFGSKCKVEPLSSGSAPVSSSTSSSGPSPSGCSSCSGHETYLCSTKSDNPIHDHCLKGSCRGFGSSGSSTCDPNSVHNQVQGKGKKCSNPCPHPLQRFLCHGSPSFQSQSETYPFGLSDITPMGFSQQNLSSTAKKGFNLYPILKVFCESGFYPLTRLLKFLTRVSRTPPETLGEFFVFSSSLRIPVCSRKILKIMPPRSLDAPMAEILRQPFRLPWRLLRVLPIPVPIPDPTPTSRAFMTVPAQRV
ncbi:variant erythrocyte surface antigen-1, alpha subunit [Babesia divergens]|uniref:Variant erythrocyte surface antigen-1, alpha subunit n=1 Tax=Babesia divergens TaxID=32595 RepID=A0AAD9GJT7_BABDI|nr:variant erythrocyte surface antigen-1, alpha subunit [Babesia divergens]